MWYSGNCVTSNVHRSGLPAPSLMYRRLPLIYASCHTWTKVGTSHNCNCVTACTTTSDRTEDTLTRRLESCNTGAAASIDTYGPGDIPRNIQYLAYQRLNLWVNVVDLEVWKLEYYSANSATSKTASAHEPPQLVVDWSYSAERCCSLLVVACVNNLPTENSGVRISIRAFILLKS